MIVHAGMLGKRLYQLTDDERAALPAGTALMGERGHVTATRTAKRWHVHIYGGYSPDNSSRVRDRFIHTIPGVEGEWRPEPEKPRAAVPTLGSPCDSCNGPTAHLGDKWACVDCGRHGGVGGE